MIITEIYVPYLDKTYEFILNEDVAISVAIDEICSVIGEKEQVSIFDSKGNMMLFNADRGAALSSNRSLYESNIANGAKLILV